MSAFNQWWSGPGVGVCNSLEMLQKNERIKTFSQASWNAALDQLEGLADGWKDRLAMKNSSFAEGYTEGERACANELLARIKELRT